jgi:hypothetical protein
MEGGSAPGASPYGRKAIFALQNNERRALVISIIAHHKMHQRRRGKSSTDALLRSANDAQSTVAAVEVYEWLGQLES